MRIQKRGPQGDDAECFVREPPQDDAMGIVLAAWRDLSTERSIGMSAGPIPASKCREWCAYHGLSRESTSVIWLVICRLERDRVERETSTHKLKQGA